MLQCPRCRTQFREDPALPVPEPAPRPEPPGDALRKSLEVPRPTFDAGVPARRLRRPLRKEASPKKSFTTLIVLGAVLASVIILGALMDPRADRPGDRRPRPPIMRDQDFDDIMGALQNIQPVIPDAIDPELKPLVAEAEDCLENEDGVGLEQVVLAMRKTGRNQAAADYYQALVRAWAGRGKEAGELVRSALTREMDPNKREEYTLGFLRAMVRGNRALEGYLAIEDHRVAFRLLANELKHSHRADILRQLVAAHRKSQPEDPLLPWYQGEVHVMQGQYRLAEKAFAAGLAHGPDAQTLDLFRASRVAARFHTGQALAAYAEIGPREETFRQLAPLCLNEEHLPQLQALLDAHEKDDPTDSSATRLRYRLKIRQKETQQAVVLFKAALAKEAEEEVRHAMISEFLYDMQAAGKVLDAYRAAPDPQVAFQILIEEAEEEGTTDEVRQLIEIHSRQYPGDPWGHYLAGVRHARENDWNKAVDAYQKAWKKAPAGLCQMMRWRLVQALYKTGQGLKAHREIEPMQETFDQLASLFAQDKKWAELESLVQAQRKELGDGPDLLFQQARATLALRGPAEAVPLLEKAHKEQAEVYKRNQYVHTFVYDMRAAGKWLDGYRLAPDKLAAFQALAPVLLAEKKDKELEQLLREHRLGYPADPHVQTYQGELHLLRGQVEQAEQRFAAAPGVPSSAENWANRRGLFRARVKAGKAAATYQEFGANGQTFQELVQLCVQDRLVGQLQELVTVHRAADPDDPELPLWELEIKWLKQDYEGTLQLLRALRQDERALTFQSWKTDDYLIRSLVRLKRSKEAIQEAETVMKSKAGNQVLLVLAHASASDPKQTLAVVEKLALQPWLLSSCYRDADLGPILRSEAFKAFRAKFPEPKVNAGE